MQQTVRIKSPILRSCATDLHFSPSHHFRPWQMWRERSRPTAPPPYRVVRETLRGSRRPRLAFNLAGKVGTLLKNLFAKILQDLAFAHSTRRAARRAPSPSSSFCLAPHSLDLLSGIDSGDSKGGFSLNPLSDLNCAYFLAHFTSEWGRAGPRGLWGPGWGGRIGNC